MRESSLQILDKLLAKTALKIELFKLVAFFSGAVAADGRHVDHAVTEFNKGTSASFHNKYILGKLQECHHSKVPLLWQVHVSNVAQDKVDKLDVFLIANPFNEALRIDNVNRSLIQRSTLKPLSLSIFGSIPEKPSSHQDGKQSSRFQQSNSQRSGGLNDK